MPDPYTSLTTDGNRKMSIQEVGVRVPTDLQSVYRPLLDSTSANLTAGATYTSQSIDVSELKELTLMVRCNEACEWKVEQSADGTNWDVVPAVTTRTAGELTLIQPIAITGIRARYTLKNNGASTTTLLRAFLMGRVN